MQDHSGSPKKGPTALNVHAGLFFLPGASTGSGETSQCGAALAWGRGSAVSVQLLLSPSVRPVSVCSARGASVPPHILGFFQWYLVLE